MDWWRPINEYCERTGPGFWDEPLNAWSNAAFWLAAAMLVPVVVRAGRQLRRMPWELWWTTAVTAGVGVGSFLFHTFAVRWAELLDVGFIALWVFSFVAIYLWRALRWSWWAVILGDLALFAAVAIVLTVCHAFIYAYLPVLAAVWLFGLHARAAHQPQAMLLLTVGVLFGISLTTAALDEPLCHYLPTGTHFVWHILNATCLYLTTRALALRMVA